MSELVPADNSDIVNRISATVGSSAPTVEVSDTPSGEDAKDQLRVANDFRIARKAY